MQNQEDSVIMYLIVRESLIQDMGLGKCCAQVGHAVSMLMLDYHRLDKRYDKYLADTAKRFDVDYTNKDLIGNNFPMTQYFLWADWLKEGICKIALKADDKEWVKLKEEYKDIMALVIDAGKTQIPAGSETVIGLPPMRQSQRSKLVKRLQVLPEMF